MKQSFLILWICVVSHGIIISQNSSGIQVPSVAKKYQNITKKFETYDVVLSPDKDAPEYWAGAPSVVRDQHGVFWMAARMRSPEHPRGLRGYEIRILRSENGRDFKKVHAINREDVPIPGFERPALLIDPVTNKFKLFACGPWKGGPWAIIKFEDADDPTKFKASTARPVIEAPDKRYDRDVGVHEYKDPYVIYANGQYHCFVIGYIRQNERIFHFVSDDGEDWFPDGNHNDPFMDLGGWHNFFVRPSSVLPLGIGYLFIYEGSHTNWYDPVYNIGTGFGFSFDLKSVQELSVESPIILSTTPGDFYTWRYSDWLWVGDEIYVYAEVSNPNQSHEVRLFRIELD